MAGMQHSSPKNPYPFSLQPAEEGAWFEPPGRGAPRLQTALDTPSVLGRIQRRTTGREEERWI